MSSPLDTELRHHSKALRGLARSLVGGDADDLLQDAAMQALQQKRPPAALRAWLQQVLRHLAGRHRRDAALRRRREREVPPPRQAPPTDRVAEHRETLRRLDSALLALPEPYQGTLLLRYFEDLTPSQIAEQTQVPLATVKSRLQRGLSLLRERLDQGGDGWRAGLVLAFGLKRALPVAAGVTTGVIVMGTGIKLVLGGVAAALALAAGLWIGNGAPPAPPTGPTSAPSQAQWVVAATGGAATRAGHMPPERSEVAAAGTADPAILPTLAGRCVDLQGQPLTEVHVALSAHRTDDSNLAVDAWTDRDQTTGEDGRFALYFAVPEHVSFSLSLRRDGYCEALGRRIQVQAGQTTDLGDVPLEPAMQITGRVIDSAGMPVADVAMELRHSQPGTPRMLSVRQPLPPHSGADGTFACGGLPPGHYWLRTTNRQPAREPSVTFTLDPKVLLPPLELVVHTDAECPPIRGGVVDSAGAPIGDAMVRLGSSSVQSDRDGRFTVRPGSDSLGEGPFLLAAWAQGREWTETGPYALGDENVRLVLPRVELPSLRVIVRAADTKAPLTRFAANVASGESQRRGPSELTAQQIRNWPDGVAVLQVGIGDHFVHVDPGDGPYAPSTFVPVHVEGDTDVQIELLRLGERRLRLQTADGAPLCASVELLDCFGRTPPLQTVALPMREWNTVDGPPRAVLLQRDLTDERGELLLRGPMGRNLTLRLRGAHLALQFVHPVRLDGDGPLVIAPHAGARWRGRLLPGAIAAALFTASQPRPGDRPGNRRCGIELSREPDEQLHTFLQPLFPYAADGSFQIDGIPAGTWTVTVFALGKGYPATVITVADGQQLHQDLDVAAMRPCAVQLQVFLDGTPAADTTINVCGEHEPGTGRQPMRTQYFLRSDADGKVAFVTFAGRIGCELHARRGGQVFGVMSPGIDVPAADRFTQVLDLRLGGAQLRVLRPDGRPAANQSFELIGVTWRALGFLTDTDGQAALQHLPAGTHRVRTRIRSLCEQASRDAFVKQFGYQALQDAWLEVGTIDIRPGAQPELELGLPTAWDR